MAGRFIMSKLVQKRSALFVCDIQEKFAPGVKYFDAMVKQVNRLLQGAKVLDIPVIVSEQYSKGLGNTVHDLDIAHAKKVVEKTLFSMVVPETEPLLDEWAGGHPDSFGIILCGIEAHVCILQTALDLRQRNFNVFVVVDGCSSRNLVERNFSFQRMRDAGCVLTTAETALLELVGDSDHPQFKKIKEIIMELPTDMELKNAST